MLGEIRVLEISAPLTMQAANVFAAFGADVVAVEPLTGSLGRRMEPFLDETPGIERSLTWHALNRNKRGMTLDMHSGDSHSLIDELLPKFDIVFDAAVDGIAPLDDFMIPEKTVRIRIAPFADTGPKSHYAASDLTIMAASGAPGVTGDPDRPPLFFSVPQAMMEAGSDAAIAALAALTARDRDGVGQSGNVSARVAAMMSAMSQHLSPPSGNPEIARGFGAITIAGVQIPSIYECADGFVLISVAFGPVFGQMTQRLAKWAADENHLAPNIAEISWPAFMTDLSAKKVLPADLASLIEGLKSLTKNKTKAEFGAMARKLGLLASPVFSMKDVAESSQYRERGLFTTVTVGGRQIQVPSRFAQFSNFALETRRPAPMLSEHTVEILRLDLGLSLLEIQALFAHGII